MSLLCFRKLQEVKRLKPKSLSGLKYVFSGFLFFFFLWQNTLGQSILKTAVLIMRANSFPDVCYFATYDFFKKVFKVILPVVVDASVCVCLMNSWLFWTRNFNTFSSMTLESEEAADCTRERAHFLMRIQKQRGRAREKSIVIVCVFRFQWIKSFLYLHPSYLVVIRWSELKEVIGERAGCSCTVGCFQGQGATVFQT